jgi:carbamoyltransferase
MDLAASIQEVTEQILLRLTRALAADPSLPRNLCLAGGVALNCVANGKILRDGRWQGLWVQPAAGDAGGALGAALAAAHLELGLARTERAGSDSMMGSYLGPQFSQPEIDGALRAAGAVFRTVSEGEVLDGAARSLAAGRALGWFSGRMEFGPRALGARSILADPRSPTTQSVLNLKIKHRESFRPFAPSVLREDAHEWFDLAVDSPYMLLVADVRASRRRTVTDEQEQLFGIERLNIPRSEIPAVTHVDWSARVQTVDAATNPRYHALLSRFKEITGCPVLVNTSFNVRGEPIVCTPADAFRCFMGTEIDDLAIGNAVLRKEDQAAGLRHQHHTAFALD